MTNNEEDIITKGGGLDEDDNDTDFDFPLTFNLGDPDKIETTQAFLQVGEPMYRVIHQLQNRGDQE